MSKYNLTYNISKDDVGKFLSRVSNACKKLLFDVEHAINEQQNESNNGMVKINLAITATPSTCAHMLSHDNLLLAIYYWNDDAMYNIFV